MSFQPNLGSRSVRSRADINMASVHVIDKRIFSGGETGFVFKDIPGDFFRLQVEVYGRQQNNAGGVEMNMTVNGLTSAIYDRQRMWKTGTGTALTGADSSLGQTSIFVAGMPGTNYPAGQAAGAIVDILGANQLVHKALTVRVFKWWNSTSTYDNLVLEEAGGIRLADRIRSIEFPTLSGSAQLVAGSYAVLRGFA